MLISAIDNPVKRAFYEMETIRGCWSYKELERQIASLYYERSGLSKNKEALSALVQQQATLLQPKDVINTPVTLEFLGLNEHALVTDWIFQLTLRPMSHATLSNRNEKGWCAYLNHS